MMDFNRRQSLGAILWVCSLGLMLTCLPPASSQETKIEKKTFTYKTVGNVEIKADVYPAQGKGPHPVLVWIHGGALISGERGGIDRSFLARLAQAGYVMVSIDYRLAPETKLPEIIADLKDAYRWVHDKGPELFQADPHRIAVGGGSAGGYLTLMTGFCVTPTPRALVSFWGYGDIKGDWYTKPDPYYSKQPAVSKEEAYKAVGPDVITGTYTRNNRGRFYLYCRQNGLWTREVAGYDREKDPHGVDQFCPILNVTAKYPPTFLIHGTADTDVPFAQSDSMAKELTKKGVPNEFLAIKGMGHGFGRRTDGHSQGAYEQVMQFLEKHNGISAGSGADAK